MWILHGSSYPKMHCSSAWQRRQHFVYDAAEGQTLCRPRGPGPETAAVASERVRVCIVLNSSLPQLSSTPLQVLLYLNSWYFAAFYLAEILMFIYKGQSAHLHMKPVALGSKISSKFKLLKKKKSSSKCFIS